MKAKPLERKKAEVWCSPAKTLATLPIPARCSETASLPGDAMAFPEQTARLQAARPA